MISNPQPPAKAGGYSAGGNLGIVDSPKTNEGITWDETLELVGICNPDQLLIKERYLI